MIIIQEFHVWGLLGLMFVLITFLGTYHFSKLTDRLEALNVHTDEQVKYFTFITTQFIGVLPLLLAAACAIMMVYTDNRFNG